MTSSFLILHGWQNHRPEGHWQHWLAARLTDLGHEVVYPQLPDPDNPELDVWLAEFERHLTAPARDSLRPGHQPTPPYDLTAPGHQPTPNRDLTPPGHQPAPADDLTPAPRDLTEPTPAPTTPTRPRIVIAHSLATVTWLHALARNLPGLDAVARTLLVSPVTVVTDYPEIAGFALPPLTGLTPPSPTRIVAGDDDPYCPEGAQAAYGDPLGVTAEVLPGAGHLTPDDGYGPWPSVLEWCLDGETRLTAR
ncbi:RBBP9/YdeN family alpha/beta hydrolase [Streptomyces acidiscabies]|uniref:RBBP9/YdeN family alpha/beta hydrolase n=1 Tax=Streptomyces acidiscabies TaxID=42234 RepID=UPI0038F66531